MKAAILLLCATLSLGAAAPSGDPLTVDDLLALVEGGVGEGVILEMVASRGSRLAVSVDDLLRLKAAGAGDRLLEALVRGPLASPAAGAAGADRPAGLRVYMGANERGEPILHVTNLDPSGRRLGGELAEAPRPRLAAEPSQSASASGDAYPEPPEAPVIINVYPQSGPGAPDPGYGGIATSWYPAGRYPGLLCCTDGGRRGKPHGARAPRDEFFGRPRIIDTAPYRASTAAQRNRARFRRN